MYRVTVKFSILMSPQNLYRICSFAFKELLEVFFVLLGQNENTASKFSSTFYIFCHCNPMQTPVSIPPWRGIYRAADYGDSCLTLDQSNFFPWNHTQSEDCLYLNVFTPGERHSYNKHLKSIL